MAPGVHPRLPLMRGQGANLLHNHEIKKSSTDIRSAACRIQVVQGHVHQQFVAGSAALASSLRRRRLWPGRAKGRLARGTGAAARCRQEKPSFLARCCCEPAVAAMPTLSQPRGQVVLSLLPCYCRHHCHSRCRGGHAAGTGPTLASGHHDVHLAGCLHHCNGGSSCCGCAMRRDGQLCR